MIRLFWVIVLGVLGTVGYRAWHRAQLASQPVDAYESTESDSESDSAPERHQDARYHCDGRKRCPQMHSCEEATWFINNCSGMEMDGDGDGVPCEKQWCN